MDWAALREEGCDTGHAWTCGMGTGEGGGKTSLKNRPMQTRARGAACSNSRPHSGAKTFGGLEGGGGWRRWVSRSAAGVPRGGSVGTPTYIPQHDPHDTLMMLNTQKWGKQFFRKNFAH